MKKLFFFLTSIATIGQLSAQDPYKALGIKENEIEYLTLSKGRYDEFHGYNDFESVGSSVIDMQTNKIVHFIDEDSVVDVSLFEFDNTTRFLTQDPLAEKYYQLSPYSYTSNNPIRFVDPDGCEIMLPGDEKAQQAYVSMLHNSTGNNYEIKDNKLSLIGSDDNFKGTKSESLINTVQKGIDSKDVFTLSLTGSNGDDKSVFIDSYTEAKIDVSDLSKLGETSTALQGAAIGHFLNEVQAVDGYSTANSDTRAGMFNSAHQPSLSVEGKIYGELIGDKTITTRTDIPTGAAQNGYRTLTREFNAANRFAIVQGATSTTTIGNEVNGMKVPFSVKTVVYNPNGELKSVKKLQ
jgi:hypothetical protein